MSLSKSKCWYSNNGRGSTVNRALDGSSEKGKQNNGKAHLKKYKQLFEYQHLLLLRDIWWSNF